MREVTNLDFTEEGGFFGTGSRLQSGAYGTRLEKERKGRERKQREIEKEKVNYNFNTRHY